MSRSAKTALIVLSLSATAIGLSGCVQMHLSDDYGVALRQDIAAQIADPDAHYAGTPAPGSKGTRVFLAQDRYDKGMVIQPAAASASKVGADNGGSQPAAPPAAPASP